MSAPVSVMLVDDHDLVRKMLEKLIEHERDMTVVASVDRADLAVAMAFEQAPDVALMDIDLPGLTSFEAAKAIRLHRPDVRIVFLSGFISDAYIEQALELESSGYLTKDEPPEQVLEAIRAAVAGRRYFSPCVSERIIVDSLGPRLAKKEQSRLSSLTSRELEVLRHLSRGLSQKEIASFTNRSPKTIHNHCTSLMTKLDIHNRVELARFAIREGLVEA